MISAERERIACGELDWRRVKRLGFADVQLARFLETPEREVRATRFAAGVRATYKTVDTCAAEFAAHTPYHYSTAEALDIRGSLNVQCAVDGDHVYVIEANPRTSRTVLFASKATGMSLGWLARAASQIGRASCRERV